MKKLLILVATVVFATSFSWANPTVNMSTARIVDKMPNKVTNKANVMDNFKLQSKAGESLQATSEIIFEEIVQGQVNEMGPASNYNITYDPISKTIFGISCLRGWNSTYDSLRRAGYLRAVPYTPGQVLTTSYTKLMWDITYPFKENGTVSVPTYDWYYPTVIVANPTNTTDRTKLKVSVAATYLETPANSTTGNFLYNWFGVANTTNLLNPDAPLDKSSLETGTIYANSDPYYILAQPLKGHVAYLNDTKEPYAIYFSRLFNTNNAENMPSKYALVSINLNKTDNGIGDGFEKIQLLPKSVEDIFSSFILTPTNRLSSSMNLDADKENNIYLAFNNVTNEVYSNINFAAPYTKIPTPVVIKFNYDNTTSINEDMVPTSFEPDIMPLDVWKNYIGRLDGDWDTTRVDYAPFTPVSHNNSNGADLPFIVYDTNSYSFLTTMTYYMGGGTAVAAVMVEINKSNGKWSIRTIDDLYNTWSPSKELNTAVYLYPPEATNHICGAFHDYGIFAADTADSTKLVFNGNTFSHDMQISMTADEQYLVVKWRETDKTKNFIKHSSPLTFGVERQIYWSDGINYFDVTTDNLYYSKLMLSYRRVDDSVWSEPIEISAELNNTISFRGTYMPRIVPDLQNVLISFAYAAQQDAIQETLPKLVANNYASWQYSGIVSANAMTGKLNSYESIKEEGPATANILEAYPNPATNVVNFKFGLLKPANTKLTVTNTLGQEIAVLVDEFCNPKEYIVDYNVSSLPAGTYLFTLTSGALVQTKAFTVSGK